MMIILKYVILLLFINNKSLCTSFDSIISSQCKSRCLSLYPWIDYSTNINNSLNKKRSNTVNLLNVKWHRVMELCAKNTMCLQCSLPCDIPKSLLENCKYLCKNRHSSCLDSCNLLTQLNNEKYGTCEPLFTSENEVTLNNDQCERDSDCEDVQKCCQKKCMRPTFDYTKSKYPSIPTNLSIIERKKGKTVILNWKSDTSLVNREPIIYVVEGKWSLDSDSSDLIASKNEDDTMTKWGYLAQTVNNNWIILRSIHRGRLYKFRVAAISPSGSTGYSQATDLFMLSQQPKPPSIPLNLTLDNTSANKILSWLPPKRSDLPIHTFKILIYEVLNDTQADVTKSRVVVFDNNNNNNNDDDDDNEDYDEETSLEVVNHKAINTNLIKINEIYVQASQHKFDLKQELDSSKMYSIEVYALSKYRGQELSSLPAKCKYNPLPTKSLSTQMLPLMNRVQPQSLITNFTIAKAYFQNGLVKAKLTWILNTHLLASSKHSHMYTITWFSIKCAQTDNTSFNQQLPISATTVNTFFEIYELKFNCDYVVNVKYLSGDDDHDDDDNIEFLNTKNLKYVTSAQFKIDSCEKIQVVGNVQPHCPNRLFETSSMSTSVTMHKKNEPQLLQIPKIIGIKYKLIKHVHTSLYNVEFTWKLDEASFMNDLVGYQITIVPKSLPGLEVYLSKNIGSIAGIVSKNEMRFVANSLSSRVQYIFQIQCLMLNNKLLGSPTSIEFQLKPIRLKKTKVKLNNANDIQEMLSKSIKSDYYYYKTNAAQALSFLNSNTSFFYILYWFFFGSLLFSRFIK